MEETPNTNTDLTLQPVSAEKGNSTEKPLQRPFQIRKPMLKFIYLGCLTAIFVFALVSLIIDASDNTPINNWGQSILGLFTQSIIGGTLIFVACHMIYIRFIRGKLYKNETFTPNDFNEYRKANNMPEESSDEENEMAANLLEDAFGCWQVVDTNTLENGEVLEYRKPRKMKEIRASVKLIDQAINLTPTDPDVVERINELTEVINSNDKREFFGSKVPIYLAGGLAIILFFTGEIPFAISLIVGSLIYWIATQPPLFMIEKRAERGSSDRHAGMLAGIFAMIAGAQTITTVTRWSDGSKTKDADNSEHFIAWAIALIVVFIMAVLIFVWSFINYLRNYVFYF